MSGQGIDLGDVAAWARDFEAGDPALVVLAVNELTLDGAHQAIVQLLALTSLALAGTGGREPIAWLAAVIDDQRRRPDLDSPT